MSTYSLAIVYDQDSPTVSLLGQYFFDSAYPWPDPIYVDIRNEDPELLAQFIEEAQIREFPTILFIKEEDGQQRIVTRLEGEQSYNTIKRVAEDVTAGIYDNWTDGTTPGGSGWLNLNNLFQGPRLLIWAAVLLYALKK